MNVSIHLLSPDLAPISECSAAQRILARHNGSAHVEHKGRTTNTTNMRNAPKWVSNEELNGQTCHNKSADCPISLTSA